MVSGCLPGRDTDVAAPCTHQELQSGAQDRSTRPPAGSRAFSLPWGQKNTSSEAAWYELSPLLDERGCGAMAADIEARFDALVAGGPDGELDQPSAPL